jgi:DtxR family transcriptional regulator, Mn-dependent transcriptional regulator
MKIPEIISSAAENYLKLIYHLLETENRATIKMISGEMGVKASSATSMVQKLSELGMVGYTPYRSVTLTPEGRRVALEVIRHHRLIELYLRESLGYSLEDVHEDAEELEHAISEEFEKRIDAALGFPKTDPHGSPIPGTDGVVTEREQIPLFDAPLGVYLTVSQVAMREKDVMGYVAALGIVPGARVKLIEKKPHRGPFFVQIAGGVKEMLGEEVAKLIYLVPRNKRRGDEGD